MVWALPQFKRVPFHVFPRSLDNYFNLYENFRLCPAGKERAQGSQMAELTRDFCSQMKQEQTRKDLVEGGKSQLQAGLTMLWTAAFPSPTMLPLSSEPASHQPHSSATSSTTAVVFQPW